MKRPTRTSPCTSAAGCNGITSGGTSPRPEGRSGFKARQCTGSGYGRCPGGIGDLQDGEYFRRIRPFAEGTFWETGEYRLIPALENNQFSTGGLDEFWVGETQIPVVGTVRVGHVKDPMGLEGDMTASSRCMTFMERSSYSEAIELNQNFVTGIWFSNNYFDQRMTWQAAVFRPDQAASSGVFFGDGQSGVQFRLTGLPLYEDEGRHLLHLGISGGWRDGTTNLGSVAYTGNTIELRARPDCATTTLPVPPPVPSPSRTLTATGWSTPGNRIRRRIPDGPGTLVYPGTFLGTGGVWLELDQQCDGRRAKRDCHWFVPVASPQNYMFNGGYIQLAYMLTGENRAYDKRLGTLAREYFGKQGPYEDAWVVRDEDGRLCWGEALGNLPPATRM